jgi:hypothetical protein
MSTIPGSVASQPAPAAPVEELAETARVRPARLFLTGLPGTGIMQLLQDVSGARILNLRGFVNETIKSTCSLIGDPAAETIAEFRAFGDGQFKPTLSYLFFLGLLRKNFADFGTPGFWVRKAIEALDAGPSGQQIVVGLRTSAEFKALQEAGFTHYHVMCTATLARQRASQLETVSGLAPALDADVQQKISMKRNGPRLNVVWNDTIAPLSTRFVSVETFRKEVVGIDQSMVESDQVQIL